MFQLRSGLYARNRQDFAEYALIDLVRNIIYLLKDTALPNVQPGMDAGGMPGSGRGELWCQFNGRPAMGKPVEKRMGAKLFEVAPPKAIDKA